MSNPKGSGKGGRKRMYGDLPVEERVKLSKEKFYEGKRKINFTISEEYYQQFLKLEEQSGCKFHSDFLKELLDSYENMMQVRNMIVKNGVK